MATTISKHPPVNKAALGHKPIRYQVKPSGGTPKPGGPGGAPPPHKPTKRQKANELQAFLWAEGEQESGNNYDAVNASSGALGRWQVMPSNLPVWLPESGQKQMTPDQFLHNHKAQNAVALTILGGYFKHYGPAGAAAMWYSGQPDPNVTYGDPPVNVYVQDVLELMGSTKVGTITTTGTSIVMPFLVPKPTRQDSWSSQVVLASEHLDGIGNAFHNSARLIRASYTRK